MTPEERLNEWWNTEPFGWDNPDTYNGILELLKEAVATEREECAKIAEDEIPIQIPRAIRARGKTE